MSVLKGLLPRPFDPLFLLGPFFPMAFPYDPLARCPRGFACSPLGPLEARHGSCHPMMHLGHMVGWWGGRALWTIPLGATLSGALTAHHTPWASLSHPRLTFIMVSFCLSQGLTLDGLLELSPAPSGLSSGWGLDAPSRLKPGPGPGPFTLVCQLAQVVAGCSLW